MEKKVLLIGETVGFMMNAIINGLKKEEYEVVVSGAKINELGKKSGHQKSHADAPSACNIGVRRFRKRDFQLSGCRISPSSGQGGQTRPETAAVRKHGL